MVKNTGVKMTETKHSGKYSWIIGYSILVFSVSMFLAWFTSYMGRQKFVDPKQPFQSKELLHHYNSFQYMDILIVCIFGCLILLFAILTYSKYKHIAILPVLCFAIPASIMIYNHVSDVSIFGYQNQEPVQESFINWVDDRYGIDVSDWNEEDLEYLYKHEKDNEQLNYRSTDSNTAATLTAQYKNGEIILIKTGLEDKELPLEIDY